MTAGCLCARKGDAQRRSESSLIETFNSHSLRRKRFILNAVPAHRILIEWTQYSRNRCPSGHLGPTTLFAIMGSSKKSSYEEIWLNNISTKVKFVEFHTIDLLSNSTLISFYFHPAKYFMAIKTLKQQH